MQDTFLMPPKLYLFQCGTLCNDEERVTCKNWNKQHRARNIRDGGEMRVQLESSNAAHGLKVFLIGNSLWGLQ